MRIYTGQTNLQIHRKKIESENVEQALKRIDTKHNSQVGKNQAAQHNGYNFASKQPKSSYEVKGDMKSVSRSTGLAFTINHIF